MSTPSTTAHDSATTQGTQAFGTLLRPVEAAGFWAAIGLPFVYIPLVLTGMETGSEQVAAVLLIAAHVVALYLGRHYKND